MRLIYLGTLFGILIWFINFYILAPAVNAFWFSQANPFTQFLLHALGFGMILGIYFASVHFKIPSAASLYKKIELFKAETNRSLEKYFSR